MGLDGDDRPGRTGWPSDGDFGRYEPDGVNELYAQERSGSSFGEPVDKVWTDEDRDAGADGGQSPPAAGRTAQRASGLMTRFRRAVIAAVTSPPVKLDPEPGDVTLGGRPGPTCSVRNWGWGVG